MTSTKLDHRFSEQGRNDKRHNKQWLPKPKKKKQNIEKNYENRIKKKRIQRLFKKKKITRHKEQKIDFCSKNICSHFHTFFFFFFKKSV